MPILEDGNDARMAPFAGAKPRTAGTATCAAKRFSLEFADGRIVETCGVLA
jgi:hypothetical protein